MRELEVGIEERGRSDLYIVSENLQQEEQEELEETKERRNEVLEEETGGHINQSFASSEQEEEEVEGRRERPGEMNYTALSRATTAIVSLSLTCTQQRPSRHCFTGGEGRQGTIYVKC